uniref:Methyltransferase type 11 domain-containing protein n=1 Tax=Ciona intestinalis TaxID=7719 RepID=H2XY59_CIOIN
MAQKPLDEVYGWVFNIPPAEDNPTVSLNYYDEHGATWDSDMKTLAYTAPEVAAQKAASLVSQEQMKNFKLLDLGAGTGLSGVAFRSAGFLGNMSALDGSEGMLKVAMEKGIYSDVTEHILTSSNPLPYPDQSFDMVFNVGAFTIHNIEPDCIEDALRVLKPNSYLVTTVRMHCYMQDYKIRFYDELNRLEAAGLMKFCSREKFLHYRLDEVSDEFEINLADQYGEVLVLQKSGIN